MSSPVVASLTAVMVLCSSNFSSVHWPVGLVNANGGGQTAFVSLPRGPWQRSRRESLPLEKGHSLEQPAEKLACGYSSPRMKQNGLSEKAGPSEDTKDDASPKFDLNTALFCAGLAFDAYTEPPSNSSRWEKGSSGLNVAFLSTAFTRALYKGLVEVQPLQCWDLPDDEDAAESLLSGGGVDAYLLVAVVEGKWKEDIQVITNERYNDGVLGLQGCAHVGRSETAWSNVNEQRAKAAKKRGGSGAYHVGSSWGRGGRAVWKDDPPFYLYVQDPSDARLVFTVMDQGVLSAEGLPIGSVSKRIADVLPAAKDKNPVQTLKTAAMKLIRQQQQQQGGLSAAAANITMKDVQSAVIQEWTGTIPLTSKPRKKDKNSQIALGATAGALVAGPAGAAVGGFLGSMYEPDVRGKIDVKLRYIPIPTVGGKRQRYRVTGGQPGVNWGELYERRMQKTTTSSSPQDFEFCFFVQHEKTGCSCAVYRSLEQRLIAISFRGTMAPIDLVTDAQLVQDPWVQGEDVETDGKGNRDAIRMVHSGFRSSLDSASRRLKELVLACVAPGDDFSHYNVLVTGHSLGGALATLFVADVAEFGFDAGRGLPQKAPSEPWWNSIATTLLGRSPVTPKERAPPRPKTLSMYNFGSPRVGNDAFVAQFDAMVQSGQIDAAYRIVNGEDVVARMPRTVDALALGKIGYDHVGSTVFISVPPKVRAQQGRTTTTTTTMAGKEDLLSLAENSGVVLWVEGQDSDQKCPVRDGAALTSPLAEGSLLGDIVASLRNSSSSSEDDDKASPTDTLAAIGRRLQSASVMDLPTVLGIDKRFTERETKIIQSILSGEAIRHHLEDEYYMAMGRALGYRAVVGTEICELEDLATGTREEAVQVKKAVPVGVAATKESDGGGGGDQELGEWDSSLESWLES